MENTSEKNRDTTAKRRIFTRTFTRSIVHYAVTCVFLAVINYRTSPQYWWVAWVAAGWGLNLLLSLIWRLPDEDGTCGTR